MEKICSFLKRPIYGVLGNHDTIRMVPGLEDMGIRMLLNENHAIKRGDQQIYLAGIDDAHFYRVDNIEKAASGIPVGEFSILLSHTPEVYQQASYADFSLLLGGHTHGGQICLPGRIPITLDSVLPRHMGSGSWKYRDMVGYTSAGAGSSIVPASLISLPSEQQETRLGELAKRLDEDVAIIRDHFTALWACKAGLHQQIHEMSNSGPIRSRRRSCFRRSALRLGSTSSCALKR